MASQTNKTVNKIKRLDKGSLFDLKHLKIDWEMSVWDENLDKKEIGGKETKKSHFKDYTIKRHLNISLCFSFSISFYCFSFYFYSNFFSVRIKGKYIPRSENFTQFLTLIILNENSNNFYQKIIDLYRESSDVQT